MNWLTSFPGPDKLLSLYPDIKPLDVNAHIHTPFSFSCFTEINEIFEQATLEKIALLGINDFFVTDGYEPFCNEALQNGVFPLFNIEFIGLMKKEQQAGIRINDPNNPGRCYFCGKGLDFPFHAEPKVINKLQEIIRLSQDQVIIMIDKLNSLLQSVDPEIQLNYTVIRDRYARNLVRERHLAKALRVAVYEKYRDSNSGKDLLARLFGGVPPVSALSDIPALENEIRSKLLKAGGIAFVEEDDNTFLSLEEITGIIINAGGIPCYPVLLDDNKGRFTEYEQSYPLLLHELSRRNINCIELIPGRNDVNHLEKFVNFFHERGFVILMGTEHNTPEKMSLTCNTRDKKPLSETIRAIAWEGACIVATHQYLRARGEQGYINSPGFPLKDNNEHFIRMGNALIHYQNQQKLTGT